MKSGELLRDLHIYFNDIEDLDKKENEINSFITTLEDFKIQVHNEKIGITEENLEEKVTEWLKNSYLVENKGNYFSIEYEKQDYEDILSENDVLKILEGKTKEERYDIFWEIISEHMTEYEFYEINYLANEICNDLGYIEHDTEIEDILTNLIAFDYDTYLEEDYNINLIIDFNNQDSNSEFINSSNLENCKNNNLYTLLQKQGYTKKDYENNLKFLEENKDKIMKNKYDYDYSKIENLGGSIFLTTILEEIENNINYDYFTSLVVLKKITLKELIENENFTINTINEIGLFNWVYGSGSLLGIKLEKPIILNREKDIFKIQVENASYNNEYTVNQVYGLLDNSWKY